jgi:hypothetical protein
MATNRVLPSRKNPQAAIQGQFGDLEVVSVDTEGLGATFRVKGSNGPEFSTRLSMIQPLSAEDSDQLWQLLVDDIMSKLRNDGMYPTFVKGYQVWTDEDSTGEPSVYVRILVAPSKGAARKSTVKQWNQFLDVVHESLLRLRLKRWPYVQLGEAHSR